MTSITEIFAREDKNSDNIYLYPEGVFYKAYMRSAFLFRRDHGDFKPIKRQLKNVERPLISIGFPKSTLVRYFPEQAVVTTYNDGSLSIPCPAIDLPQYEAWAEEIPLYERPAVSLPREGSASVVAGGTGLSTPASRAGAAPASAPKAGSVVERLRAFRLDSASPVECMVFLASLQKELDTVV